jgi:hypothetical protein
MIDWLRRAPTEPEIELGGKRVMETKNGQLYGFAQGPLFGVTKPFNGDDQHCGNGNMIALRCASKEKVGEVYAKALALGSVLYYLTVIGLFLVLARNSLEASFAPAADRARWVAALDDTYARLAV